MPFYVYADPTATSPLVPDGLIEVRPGRGKSPALTLPVTATNAQHETLRQHPSLQPRRNVGQENEVRVRDLRAEDEGREDSHHTPPGCASV